MTLRSVPITDVHLVHNTFIHTDPSSFAGRDAVQIQGTATTFRLFAYGNVTDGFADAYVLAGSSTVADGGGNWNTMEPPAASLRRCHDAGTSAMSIAFVSLLGLLIRRRRG